MVNKQGDQLGLDPQALRDMVTGLFKLAGLKDEWPEDKIIGVVPQYVALPEAQDALRRLVTPMRK